MIERVVENWLTNANERSFEIPFCQLLTGEGYQVVHLSRHGSFEQGKDVLAITPDGTPCAFQLKGSSGKITLATWGKEYSDQVTRLVELPIRHPSIDPSAERRVYFVTNGELEEEVRVEIADRNLDWERRGLPTLETIIKGQLLARFLKLHSPFWPTELTMEHEFLELYLADGKNCLNKQEFSSFLESLVKLDKNRATKAECSRRLSSAAVAVAYLLSSYENESNHVAIFEGWVVYTSILAAMVDKYNLRAKYWKNSLDIAFYAIETSLQSLCNELISRVTLTEGDPLSDPPFYRGRVTWIVGLVASFCIWKALRKEELPDDISSWHFAFMKSQQRELELWGEAAIPHFLANFWYLSRFEPKKIASISMLSSLIDGLVRINGNPVEGQYGLPDPYHQFAEVINSRHGFKDPARMESYFGQAYSLDSLIQLLVRRGWRQRLASLWPKITKVGFSRFRPNMAWQYALWHVEDGTMIEQQPKMTQSWKMLQDTAGTVEYLEIPSVFQDFPELLLMFINVYPHRLNPDVVKYLDDKICSANKTKAV